VGTRSLAPQVASVLAEPQRLQRVAENARARALQWSEAAYGRKLHAILGELAAARGW